ncbi:MAG: aldolase/citrate lyase family protein [Gammaproteobacteria bacterium]|nr:aldolase/citrate lyase family protein [Gammaproteobacteria bacterium]
MELRPNRVRRRLEAGEPAFVVGGVTHADDIDALGPIGFDGIWLEGEHGGVDAADLGNLTRACDIWGMTSLVRVNRNDQGLIYRTLDRGAQAIVVPHVDTRADAENVVAGGKFPPLGKRGLFVSRQGYGVGDYLARANDETLLIALIEDIEAWRNLDEILEVEGIGVFFVAPSDFAASMGHIGNIGHPDVQEKIEDSLRRIVAAGRTAGTLCMNDNVQHFAEIGVRCFFTSTGPWVAAGARAFKANALRGVR